MRTAGRRGTFVATDGDTARATVARATADFAAVVQGQGMAAEEALRIVIAVLPGIRPGPSKAGSPGAGS